MGLLSLSGLAVGGHGDGGLGHAVDHGHHHQVVGVALNYGASFLDGHLAVAGFGPAVHDVVTAPERQSDLELVIRVTAFQIHRAGSGGAADAELRSATKRPSRCLSGQGQDQHRQQGQAGGDLLQNFSKNF